MFTKLDPRQPINVRKLFGMIALDAVALVIFLFVVLGLFGVLAERRESKTSVEAAPSTGRFVRADDVSVFIQEAGPKTGQPVLLIHGTGSWSEIWRETMTSLADAGFRVIAMDLPPFGYSDKPAGVEAYSRERQAKRIVGLLDTLELSRVILVGHSVGGRPTMEAALMAPSRVRALVLVDPALGFAGSESRFLQNEPSWPVRALFAIDPLRNAVVATFATNPLTTKYLFRSFVSNDASVTDERVTMLQQPAVVRGLTRGTGDWMEYALTSEDTSLGSNFSNFTALTMPVFLVWGRLDDITPLSEGERLQKLIPGSKLEIMDGVGHVPYVEDPEAFNELLLKIINL